MRARFAAALGSLLIACDQASSPVAPSASPTGSALVGLTGPAYTARGTAVDVSALSVNQKVCDVSIPKSGGNVSNSVASLVLPGVLSTKVLYCNAQGQNNQSLAEAGVFELILTVGGNTIFADVLTSMAAARCPTNGGPYTSSGSSSIARLNVNGQSVVVGTAPNQRIPLPNGYIVVNEQTSFVTPYHAGRTVIALRVVINSPLPVADVAIARSQAHIDCP